VFEELEDLDSAHRESSAKQTGFLLLIASLLRAVVQRTEGANRLNPDGQRGEEKGRLTCGRDRDRDREGKESAFCLEPLNLYP